MAITFRNFTQLVSDQVTAIQGALQGAVVKIVDLSIGSVERAIVEAVAGVLLWTQWEIGQVAELTRAASSNGTDLDNWMADYGFTRLPAVAATGQVTFSRFTPTAQAIVPIGTLVQTQGNTAQFTVTLDTTNVNYSAALGGYVLAPSAASIVVPVAASVAGAAGNVAANALNTLASPIPGVDTVTNAFAFTNGADAESDTSFRARFVLYIGSLSKATLQAVESAIGQVQQNLTYIIVENQNYAGQMQDGFFFVVVNDGTGSPSSTLLNNVYSAINAVRPLTVSFAVYAPVLITANVAMTLVTQSTGTLRTQTVAAVQSALQSYLSGMAIGQSLSFTRLAAIAYNTSSDVLDVTGVTLNGGTSDLAINNRQLVWPGTVSVS